LDCDVRQRKKRYAEQREKDTLDWNRDQSHHKVGSIGALRVPSLLSAIPIVACATSHAAGCEPADETRDAEDVTEPVHVVVRGLTHD